MYNNKMSPADADALKRRILHELNMRASELNSQGSARPMQSAYNRQPVRPVNNAGFPQSKATLNPDEFHADSYVQGSTGVYRDMKGGAHFSEYDCGHEYNDNVVRNTDSNNRNQLTEQIRAAFQDKNQVRNAFVMSEVFERPGRRRLRYSEKFR